MLLRALAIWCGLLLVAFVNGAFRVLWLTPVFGDPVSRVISAVILSAIVAAVAWLAIVWLHPHTANEALLIGDEWVLLTIGFEVPAGSYVVGTSWHRLLMEYNVSQGALWELVLVTMLVALEYNVSQGALWELVLVTMLVAPTVARIGHRRERRRLISSARKAIFGR